MTGHIGARTNRQVALLTDDFRLYHRLVPFFEARGVPVVGIAPNEDVPATVQVLLGGPASDPRSLPLRRHLDASLLATLQALDERRHVRETGRYHRVVFGVDPGRVIGLAVLADEQVLMTTECRSAAETAQRVRIWQGGLAAEVWEVHVGDGDPPIGRALLQALSEEAPDVRRSLVPETATTPFSAQTGSRHADAAIQIARRRPEGDP